MKTHLIRKHIDDKELITYCGRSSLNVREMDVVEKTTVGVTCLQCIDQYDKLADIQCDQFIDVPLLDSNVCRKSPPHKCQRVRLEGRCYYDQLLIHARGSGKSETIFNELKKRMGIEK